MIKKCRIEPKYLPLKRIANQTNWLLFVRQGNLNSLQVNFHSIIKSIIIKKTLNLLSNNWLIKNSSLLLQHNRQPNLPKPMDKLKKTPIKTVRKLFIINQISRRSKVLKVHLSHPNSLLPNKPQNHFQKKLLLRQEELYLGSLKTRD